MSKKFVYVIHKDGLYLLSYRVSGIKEFDGSGKLADVYTCVWGTGRKGARAFQHKTAAEEMARQLEADGVESVLTEVEDDA